MKSLLFVGLFFAAVMNLRAADPHSDKSLQGDWTPVQAELGGQAMPEAVLKTISVTLGDGIYHVSVAGDPDQGTYETDASTNPKGMTVKGTEGPNKGKTIPAIYEIQGDTLRVCYDLSGAARPKEFKSVAGTLLYLITYQRKK